MDLGARQSVFLLTLCPPLFKRLIVMNEESKPRKELSDLEKADCLTGKMIGGIALKNPGFGAGKRRRFVFDDRT